MNFIGDSWITQGRTLWSAFVLTLLLMIAIFLTARHFKLTLLDFISSPTNVRAELEQMDSGQRKAHVWITSTLDVVYPLSYGCLLAGAALRFFPQSGNYLALPALLAVAADLTEGVIQVLVLTSVSDLVELKRYVTPLKFGLVILGLIIALAGLVKVLFANLGAFS